MRKCDCDQDTCFQCEIRYRLNCAPLSIPRYLLRKLIRKA